MFINCFQKEKLEKCKYLTLCDNTIIGFKKGNTAVVVRLTDKQLKQEHSCVIYAKKWQKAINNC